MGSLLERFASIVVNLYRARRFFTESYIDNVLSEDDLCFEDLIESEAWLANCFIDTEMNISSDDGYAFHWFMRYKFHFLALLLLKICLPVFP